MTQSMTRLVRSCTLLTLLAGTLALNAACFWERSTPIAPGDLQPITVSFVSDAPLSTRTWLRQAHAQLGPLLPQEDSPPVLTDQLAGTDGKPISVWRYFRERQQDQHRILGNFFGLMHSAQAAGAHVLDGEPTPWPGFDDVWVPINAEFSLSGRLGLARQLDGTPRHADCIVLIAGLFGDLAVQRTRDIGEALLSAGFHVLAVELRGLGRTGAQYPRVRYTYGGLEVGDLLAVDTWLQARSEVRETGLIGHCWGANLALLVAWEDGRSDSDPSVAPDFARHLRPRDGRAHYRAGIMAFSPVLKFEELLDTLASRRWSGLVNPVLAKLQTDIEKRADRWNLEPNRGDLRKLIQTEVRRSELKFDTAGPEGLTYLRLLPSRPIGNKLELARTPVLIVHAVNDPVGSAQHVADLFAELDNPNVGGLVLAGGGHVGFAPYCRAYFYNLISGFFDPEHGAAASIWPAPQTVQRTDFGRRWPG